MSKAFAKSRSAAGLLATGPLSVDDAAHYQAALEAIEPNHRATVVARWNAETIGATESAYVLGTPDTPAVTRAFDAVTPQTIAKFLFASGSTGAPKAVINTHGMLTA